ncbi:MAG: hypothetical protein SNJ79_10745 [Sphingomonadaceae bacterium]
MSGRRWPLWTTLIPLAVGLAGWWWVWSGWAARLETTLRGILPAETAIRVGGFPYRLQATTGPVRLEWRDVAAFVAGSAEQMVVNRQPWRVDRQVVNLSAPRLEAGLAGLAGAGATVTAPRAQASLRLEERRIARLSIVWEEPELRLAFLPVPARARRFELHVRETPVAGEAARTAPTAPVQAQAVIAGEGVRFGNGDPLRLSASLDLTAATPVGSLAGWAAGGTGELREVVLSDATGEVARMSATLSPGRDGRLLLAGTIETVCPRSVRAALAGLPPVSEKRTRKPQQLALTGIVGEAAELPPADPAAVAPPVRGQEPDCPRLR